MTDRSSKRCPHGAKGTQLFLHVCHLHPALSPCLYLLAAPYLSFEGFDLVFCGYNVDVGLSVPVKLGSDPPCEMLVGIGEQGATPCGWPGKRVVEPVGHGHDGLFIVIVVSGFCVKVSHVRLLIRGVFLWYGGDLPVGETLYPVGLL